MPIDKAKSAFFAGGKKVELENNDAAKGMQLERDADGNWKLTLSLFISKEEATNVIRKFSDFTDPAGHPVTDPAELEKLFPNQIFLEAFDGTGKPVDIAFNRAKLLITQDKEDRGDGDGEIVISMEPIGGVGKTQNGKTQNVVVNPVQ
jgi:hypothetical protein